VTAHRLALALCGATLLAGCALNGDFGRLRPSLVSDDMHAWVGREAVQRQGAPASEFPLTDEERRLRDLAFALIQPPFDRNQWWSAFAEYGLAGPPDRLLFDRAAYWEHLDAAYRRSEASSYAQIVTDARNDVVRLEPFFASAARVAGLDARRAQSLAFVAASSGVSGREGANALARNHENAAVVGWVCAALAARAAAYRYALEGLIVGLPSPRAVEAERAVDFLRGRSAQYCAPPAGVVVAKS
jgi:hypothetical protein